MKTSTEQLLQKAERAITAAETLLHSGDTEFAIGRAYYAMFYIAKALLNEKNLQFSKHGGVHGAFGEHFVKLACSMPNITVGCWQHSTGGLQEITESRLSLHSEKSQMLSNKLPNSIKQHVDSWLSNNPKWH